MKHLLYISVLILFFEIHLECHQLMFILLVIDEQLRLLSQLAFKSIFRLRQILHLLLQQIAFEF